MPLPQQRLRLTRELNIGLEIQLKIGLPLTGLPSTEDQLLPHQEASKLPVVQHTARLLVQMLMGLVLLDLHNIQLAVGLQFRWLLSEVLLPPLLIQFSQLNSLKLRLTTLQDKRLWN